MKVLLQIFLSPFSFLYGLIVFIRNRCYDIGIFKSHKFNKTIISVGNLNLGGTGKTPHIEYLIRLLQSDYNVATLSRGYKRKTTGFIKASKASTCTDIGDEPFQYFTKFPNITVAVDEKRVNGVNKLLELNPDIDVFLLDDAYQHRAIKRDINVLITDFNKLYTQDWLMPSGTLREWKCESKRADIIIVSKSPDNLKNIEQQQIINNLKPKPHQKIFFSYIQYGNPVPFIKVKSISINPDTSILALCGIANPKPFLEHVKNSFNLYSNINFSDHHQFTNSDISKISTEFEKINSDNKVIITTEKDIMRLYLPELKEQLKNIPVFYIPIEVCFHGNGKKEFDEEILNYVKANSRN